MLYSDDDIMSDHDGPIQIDYERSSTSSDDDDVMLREEERYEQYVDHLYSDYALIFTEEDGWFRQTLPHMWLDDTNEEHHFLGNVLAGGDVDEDAPAPDPQIPVAPPAPVPPIVDGDLVKKDSPASRAVRNGEGLVFPIDKSVNRKQLIEMFGAAPSLAGIPNEALWVGYDKREPMGMGLALVTGDFRAAVLAEMEHARPSTPEDAQYFMKEVRPSRGPTAATDIRSTTVARPRIAIHKNKNRRVLDEIKSSALLKQQIESAGGERDVRWLCLDVECAIVLDGGVPIPLEIALVDITRPLEACVVYHSFFHPGNLMSVAETALMLAMGVQTAGHGIPLHSAKFLRRDYSTAASELIAALDHPHTVVVFKGDGITDYLAIKWVFAVSDLTTERAEHPTHFAHFSLPHFTSLETVFKTLNRASQHDIKEYRKQSNALCWYHQLRSEAATTRPHCAVEDSLFVRDCLLEIL